ncbi:hypothetical protein SAMN05421796_1137 [Chryseobacterium piscicola]|uniref:Uncharacterized protein n=1 Tax=Chryseobacterium piscicola TaxID=551459 RepID=A0A1N7PDM7_9FLAO|nr:hypothetical protein [Chryseobacterium piscicola]PQA90711.1 hypothetical protein B0A70_13650 [Chryseobacterium piscicola]SIT08712.1 hypothetical protein SAMN05421796_1137 [Chryseobacterium piscicola]
MYKLIEPEVAGSLGRETELDNSVFPPHVKKLHYEFSGWLGDDILESFPCYIVTDSLREDFENNKFTGISFNEVIVSKSETFLEIYPDRELPKFYWLKICGEAYKDDFFITKENVLAISEKVNLVLLRYNINNADIEEL